MWNASTGAEKPTIKDFNGPVAFSSDSSDSSDSRVSGGHGYDLVLKLFDTTTGEGLTTIEGNAFNGFNSAAFSPVNNNLIVTGNGDGTIKLWDASTGKPAKPTFNGKHGARVSAVAFSPDGKFIVSSSEDKTVKLWDVNGGELETLEGQPGDSSAVAFSAKWIASGGQDGVKLWKFENGSISD